MAYSANSKSQQRIRQRLDAVAAGGDPDAATGEPVQPPDLTPTQAAIVEVAAQTGVSMYQAAQSVTGQTGKAATVYANRALVATRAQLTLRAAMERRPGLRSKALAQKLEKAVKAMDSPDLAERHYGLKSLVTVAKIKGELTSDRVAAAPPPPNINVLVQVLREMHPEQIQDVSPKQILTDAQIASEKVDSKG